MTKVMTWVNRHHSSIGYTIGGLNLASGLSNILTGDFYTGGLNLVIGAFIVIDTWAFRPKQGS